MLLSSRMHEANKMGRKDIMKIECPIDIIDLDILGFIDHNITVNIIQNDHDRRKETAYTSEADQQCDPLQESALYHFHRTGTGSYLRSDR